MSKKKPKRKPGRPSDYDPIYCQMLVEHMASGFSYESFAGKIGKCKDTLYEWEKVHPEFSDAKSRAWSQNQLFWEEQGIRGLNNEVIKEDGPDGTKTTVTRSINATVWVFNMKNRFKWRDKPEDEEPDEPLSSIPTSDLLAIIRGNK